MSKKFDGNLVHVCVNKAKNQYADIECKNVKLFDNYTLEDFFKDYQALCTKNELLTLKVNELVQKYNALLQAYKTNNLKQSLEIAEIKNNI